ncbi:MAG: head-tail adaptor protein [Oscillospiraceae bacterium]|nr:head-tail adaptor protein [Oscillospiraceae bacterium]
MSFGKMRCRIQILEIKHPKHASGTAASEENVLASARAFREDRHGTEIWANRAAFSEATALFRFRLC